ncbi:NrtR DNA-binding winged helix domain-containing protein [Streptomyces zagrosensis]|uniref:NrtR DNA-binding winged helix domain-containing protein n=1 Tax=Streptomyces zagrosensis TaxID=1042984 RepID=A0A7W9QAA9_9ACTN|nr:hypothetical protein [Streptomyces zagrosensis]MBB5936471.1 hypothetical protein [Streptomyces zagrosensis]
MRAVSRLRALRFATAANRATAYCQEVRRKLEYTAVATAFCGESFTLSELRAVYEAIWGQHLDPSNFRRKVLNTAGLVQPTGEQRLPPTGRPAALYRRGSAWLLSPPLLRGIGHTA